MAEPLHDQKENDPNISNPSQQQIHVPSKIKKKKAKTIHALYFKQRPPYIQWQWYDNGSITNPNPRYIPYEDSEELLSELEATYYANVQSNFPKENPLFMGSMKRDKPPIYIFGNCHLPVLSKIMSIRANRVQKYGIRYNLKQNVDN